MTNIFMMACTYIVVGASINGISLLIKSDFLCKFLDQNLILLLVAILAINTTTISVILSKMREIADKNPGVDFGRTIRAMKHSTLEHIYLVGGACRTRRLTQTAKTGAVCIDAQLTNFCAFQGLSNQIAAG